MAESESGGEAPDGGLLRELSGSAVRHPSTVSAEQEMMRLSGDPLLLRAFLQRHDVVPPPAGPSAGGRISLALAGVPEVSGAREPPTLRTCYERRDRLREPSLTPTPFAPSRDDQVEAFDLADEPSGIGPRRRQASGVFLTGAALVLCALIWALG